MFPSSFPTSDGLTLHCHVTAPSDISTRAHVIYVHGLGDHSHALPYRNLVHDLAAHGFASYGFDLRGYGQSQGPRAFAERWSQLRDDLRSFVELVQRHNERQPLFLSGLSLGGLIALNYAEHHPDGLRGLVAVAPAMDESGAPALLRYLLPLLVRIAPRIPISPRLDLTRISRDDVSVREYTNDPLVKIKVTPRFAVETINAMTETRRHAESLSVPLLVLHGDADRITAPSSSADFFRLASSPDKQRRVYPGAYHNLFIETNRDEVFRDIRDWIEKRL